MLYNNSVGKTLEAMPQYIVMARKGTNFFKTGQIFLYVKELLTINVLVF